MKFHGVSLYDESTGRFVFVRPWIYYNNAWQNTDIYVSNGSVWKLVGAACTQLVPFIDKDGKYVYVNNGRDILQVPEFLGKAALKDSQGKYIFDSAHNQIYGEKRG